MVVCTAAVQKTHEPYCDSCRERVTANLLIDQTRLRDGERRRHCVYVSLRLILYAAAGPIYVGVHICSLCVCRAGFF